jgi:hypothetical protein
MSDVDWSLSFADRARDDGVRSRKEAVREAVRRSEATPHAPPAPEASAAQREKYRSQIRKAMQDAQSKATRFAFPD